MDICLNSVKLDWLSVTTDTAVTNQMLDSRSRANSYQFNFDLP